MASLKEECNSAETGIECVLSASDSYIETLNIRSIEAQPWLVEMTIKTQLLNAKNPQEKRIKSSTCIERTQLAEIQQAIGRFLQCPASLDRPDLQPGNR